jgi:hypothetical protein
MGSELHVMHIRKRPVALCIQQSVVAGIQEDSAAKLQGFQKCGVSAPSIFSMHVCMHVFIRY